MKRVIQTQIQENYEFLEGNGNIEFSVEKIEMEFSGPEVRKGYFEIRNLIPTHSPMTGFVYSTNIRMDIVTKEFKGDQVVIEYTFDSTGLEEGDVVSGEIIVVTDRGEFQLKYEAVMERASLYSSMGHIKNLFHFANLAQTNWEEAVQLFYSNRFTSLLHGNDGKYLGIYRGLSADALNERNVDEFLYAVHKKSRTQIEIKSPVIDLRSITKTVEKEITVSRNGWGYVKISAYADEPFIELDQDYFTYADFVENQLRVPYRINYDELHAGRNIGHVFFEYGDGELSVEIRAEVQCKDVKNSVEHQFAVQSAELTREYIAFRLGNSTVEKCVKNTKAIVEKMLGKGEKEIVARLYQAHILMADDRFADASFILDRVEEKFQEIEVNPSTYGYFLYLTTLVNKENEYVDKVASMVKKLYQKESYDWRLAWLMLELQEELCFRAEKRFSFLEEQYHFGANSPILYMETLDVLKKNPSLLVKLEKFEIDVLRFAAKNNKVGAALGERVQFLVSRERNFNPVLYKILESAYNEKPTKELLGCIISYLMKGNCGSTEYFKWYELGVKQELRITRLYEFYMDSMDLSFDGDLPKIVMMYFAYQNNLDYEHRAFLYANVLHRRARYPEIALSYGETVEEFVKEQILAGHVNKNLAYLYRRIVNKEYLLEENIADAYVPMLFTREIKVDNPTIRNVIVIHDKITGEQTYPVEDGVAYVPIYSENYHLILEDGRKNRFVNDKIAKPERVLWNEDLIVLLHKTEITDHVGLMVYNCENEGGFAQVTPENVYYYSRLLSSEDVTLSYKKEIVSMLVYYYFDNDCIRELDELLLNVKPEALGAEERGKFIHILVARGLYDTAFEWLTVFGPEHTSVKTVLRLASRLLERTSFEENGKLIEICKYLYRNDRYDQNILSYLSGFFEGTTRELRDMDRIIDSFGVDDYKLLEKILVQILFAGIHCPEKMDYFMRYVRNGGNQDIQKAFLARCAFDYFVLDEKADEKVMNLIEGIIRDGDEVNRISRLGLLKYYSEKPEETWDIDFINELLKKETSNGVCFPFFPIFAKKSPQMLKYTDLSFIEYKGNPTSRVIVHFCIEHENGAETEYRKEEMDNLYAGIFVRKFILFKGEEIQYYITEENGNREQLTQSSVLRKDEHASALAGKTAWRYSILDSAIESMIAGKHQEAGDKVYDYLQKDFMTREIFRQE